MSSYYYFIERNYSIPPITIAIVGDNFKASNTPLDEIEFTIENWRNIEKTQLNKLLLTNCIQLIPTNVQTYLSKQNSLELIRSNFVLNHYFPRIFRPTYMGDAPPLKVNNKKFYTDHYYAGWSDMFKLEEYNINLRTKINILARELKIILEYIQPANGANLVCFGIELRKHLILSCTEIEAVIKGVLRANNYIRICNKSKKIIQEKSYNISGDYIKVCKPMKLNEYEIIFESHPQLNTFTPFDGWNQKNASPDFYQAYNKTKHDSETHLCEANLKNVLTAFAGLYALGCAQMGERWLNTNSSQLIDFIKTSKHPKWKIEELYISEKLGYSQMIWIEENYKF